MLYSENLYTRVVHNIFLFSNLKRLSVSINIMENKIKYNLSNKSAKIPFKKWGMM